MDLLHVSAAEPLMSFAAQGKPHVCDCYIRFVLTMYCRRGHKIRRGTFPKGYAETLEMQYNQLVCCLQEMYQRLRKASLWEGKSLDEWSGHPLTHDILAALDFLEPEGEDSDTGFVERSRSILTLREAHADVENTPIDCSEEVSQPTLQDIAMPSDTGLLANVTASKTKSLVLRPTGTDQHRLLRKSDLQPHDVQMPSGKSFSTLSRSIQMDAF
jgi:hypothetical protein